MNSARISPMSTMINLIATLTVVLLLQAPKQCLLQPVNPDLRQIASLPTTTTTTTSTTTSVPALENPSNSATSESSEDETIHCFGCYDKVKEAQVMIANHESLANKEKKLIRLKAASNLATLTNNNPTQSRKPKPPFKSKGSTRNQVNTNNNSTSVVVRNRQHNAGNATNVENRSIVVSTLRVARSTSGDGLDLIHTLDSMRNNNKNNIDPALKKLKHMQEQQFNKTCRALQEVQQCLEEISRDCLGNLQFHSMQVISKQWFIRLNCPPKHDPNFKPFGDLIRSVPRFEEFDKVPVPRPISSPDEIGRRLNNMFGRNTNPIGVMLKPTLNGPASQKFKLLGTSPEQQQSAAGNTYSKGRRLISLNEVPEYDGVRVPIADGQLLLLIPCFALAVIALITLSLRYLRDVPKV